MATANGRLLPLESKEIKQNINNIQRIQTTRQGQRIL